MKLKVKKGDEVVVLSGKDIGKRGTITHVFPDDDKVIVTRAPRWRRGSASPCR